MIRTFKRIGGALKSRQGREAIIRVRLPADSLYIILPSTTEGVIDILDDDGRCRGEALPFDGYGAGVDMQRAFRVIRDLTEALDHHCGSSYSDTRPEDDTIAQAGRQFLRDAGQPD